MTATNGSARPGAGAEVDNREWLLRNATNARTPRPNPEVVAWAKRRPFTGEYKQRIPAAADAAKRAGEIGASCGGKASTAGDVQERSAMRQHTRVCRNSGGVRSNQAGQLGFEENALAQTAVSSRWTVTF